MNGYQDVKAMLIMLFVYTVRITWRDPGSVYISKS